MKILLVHKTKFYIYYATHLKGKHQPIHQNEPFNSPATKLQKINFKTPNKKPILLDLSTTFCPRM